MKTAHSSSSGAPATKRDERLDASRGVAEDPALADQMPTPSATRPGNQTDIRVIRAGSFASPERKSGSPRPVGRASREDDGDLLEPFSKPSKPSTKPLRPRDAEFAR